jgi:hypothetical protein
MASTRGESSVKPTVMGLMLAAAVIAVVQHTNKLQLPVSHRLKQKLGDVLIV